MKHGYVYWIKLPDHFDPYTKGYIGVALNYKARWSSHKSQAKLGTHVNKHLENAILKYDNLEWIVLFKGPYEECLKLEKIWRPHLSIGWNITPGGSESPMLGITHNKETKEKMSKGLKEYYKNNPEAIEALKERLKGNTNNLGTKYSEATKQLISEKVKQAYKDNPQLLEDLKKRAKESPSMLNKKHREETKLKMSVSAHRRKQVKCVETGVVYFSVLEASKAVGLKGHSPIAFAARHGKMSAGYHWEYV